MGLSVPQKQIADSKARFRVAICGRRFGKTALSVRELCRYARIPRQEIWYIAPTYRQAKEIVWRKLKYRLKDLGWVKSANESSLTIELINDSRISLKGADNYDSLRGLGLDFIVLDEFADIKPEAFFEVLSPTLADKEGEALFIGTPKGKGNWSYDLFQLHHEHEDWDSFQFTTLEGGNVSEEEIAAQRELLDERQFKQEFEADFVTSSNRVWYNFDAEHNVLHNTDMDKLTPDQQKVWNKLKGIPRTLYVGMDFNIDPMSAVVFTREDETVTAIDEIEIFSSNTDEMIDELKSRYPGKRLIVYPDPASRQRKTSAAGKTDLSILQNAGFTVKAPRAHNPVRDGVNAVNAKLLNANGKRTFYVDPSCKKLITCLERHNYKPGTTVPDKDTGYDHLTDAMRYFIDYEFPIKREVKTQAPRRWGHAIG